MARYGRLGIAPPLKTINDDKKAANTLRKTLSRPYPGFR